MDLFQNVWECFVLKHLGHQRVNFQYLSAVPVWGGRGCNYSSGKMNTCESGLSLAKEILWIYFRMCGNALFYSIWGIRGLTFNIFLLRQSGEVVDVAIP